MPKGAAPRWRKKYQGRVHYFRGEYARALEQWKALRDKLDKVEVVDLRFFPPQAKQGHEFKWLEVPKTTKTTTTTTTPTVLTLKAAIDRFLTTKQSQVGQGITPGRWDCLQRYTLAFSRFIGDGLAVADLAESHLADYHAHLLTKIKHHDYSRDTAWLAMAIVKQFVRWAYRQRMIAEMPRNMDSRDCDDLTITTPAKQIPTFTTDEVKDILKAATPTTRLYVLLALNCGMTQKDISDLKPDQVDLDLGTITRKRSKTTNCENVPVVCYKLWAETLRLLRIHRSSDPGRWLVSEENNPLAVVELSDDGKLRRWDCVAQAFKYLRASMSIKHPFKVLRKTSATMLAGSRDFCSVAELFLGHAPKTIADKHYADAPQKILDDGLDWMAGQYGVE